jgi:cyclic-di-GMP-binding protein
MPSFDVVSKVDLQEVDNAVNQVKKEIGTRYDFKSKKCSIELEKKEIVIAAENKLLHEAMVQMLKEKATKRGIGVRSFDFKEPEVATGGTLRQKVLLKEGISTEDGKKIVKIIKESGIKVQAQIQDLQVRVTGKKRDELQEVIATLKQQVTDLELQYVNMKD